MLSEFNECLDIRGLTVKKWRPFTCRPLELFFSDYKYGVLFESINQGCIDLLKATSSLGDMKNKRKRTMKILPFFFGGIMTKKIFYAYCNDINGSEQKLIAVIASFLCGMFFGEYLLLRRQKKYFCGELEEILKCYNESSNSSK